MAQSTPVRNADVYWEDLDPERYRENNYRVLRADDRQILALLSRHFLSRPDLSSGKAHGVDVGTGSNLYPALAMLPFCAKITLVDRSAAGVRWLQRWIGAASHDWDPFWHLLQADPRYSGVEPWLEISRKTAVVQADVLMPMPEIWDMGTMMFVAESITGDLGEFNLAIRNFLGSLRPGAPFAMAFMAESEGYSVAGKWFPSVPVGRREVKEAIARAADFELVDIPIPDEGPLREGYEGMILVLGTRAIT